MEQQGDGILDVTTHLVDLFMWDGFRDHHCRSHEASFSFVAEAFFRYLVDGKLPDWEVPNMITKYFITTQARELALKSSG